MSRYFCHDHPEVLTLETRVLEARPGAVLLEQSPFHPGGGGQLADRGRLAWQSGGAHVTGFEVADGRVWHLLAAPVELSGVVQVAVDREFRAAQTELHTGAHILNALVYRHFDGALITGAQLGDDLTARIDFDLPGVDNDRLRALDADLNDVIRQDLPVRYAWQPLERAAAEPGLLRSRSVAPPPTPDGTVRIVEIVGLDRQACGGTPGVDRTIPSPPYPQDRQQGPSQPTCPDRARRHADLRRSPMATTLFIVKATIPSDKEATFNRWYNEEHVPQVLQFPGLVSARRYKALEGEDRFQYMAVYELQDEATYHRLMSSDHMKLLRKEYDAHFPMSERARLAYTQVWP